MSLYWKVLGEDGEPCNGGTGRWPLPNGKPGDWMPKIDRLVPCESGYHVCTTEQLVSWLGPTIWVVETRGALVDDSDKSVVGEARLVRRAHWDARVARLFAADCAEHVLHLIGEKRDIAENAIAVARRFANGQATDEERAAAWAAARAAARAAAEDAAWAAAEDAAWAAARAAARAAAWAAAWTAARDAEQRWQADRLYQYLTGHLS